MDLAEHHHDRLTVRGAREHNLKDVSLAIPRDALVVFTGLSGSGKSSLAFDTIFAEGQRRYVESLSVYARQFLDQLVQILSDLKQGKPFTAQDLITFLTNWLTEHIVAEDGKIGHTIRHRDRTKAHA